MATWPGTLPTSPLIEGYDEDWGEIAIHSNPDEGPPISRRRFTKGIDTVVWPMLLTKTQVNTLETFFKSDCAGGAITFTLTHPRTGATITVKFAEAPNPEPENQLFRVSMKLTIMP